MFRFKKMSGHKKSLNKNVLQDFHGKMLCYFPPVCFFSWSNPISDFFMSVKGEKKSLANPIYLQHF